MIINEREMSLVLPPHPNIEIFRSKLFNDLYFKFESLLNNLILLNNINDWTGNNKQNEIIRSIFNSLVIEFKMIKSESSGGVVIVEPLFVKFGNTRDESFLMNYLMKLFKLEIDEKLKLATDDILENCAQIFKDYIIKLVGSTRYFY